MLKARIPPHTLIYPWMLPKLQPWTEKPKSDCVYKMWEVRGWADSPVGKELSLSFVPSTLIKEQVGHRDWWLILAGQAYGRIQGACWPASLEGKWVPGSVRDPCFRRNWRMMKEYSWSWRLTSVCTCTGAWTPSPPHLHHHHTQWPCWPLSTFPLEPKSSSADSVSELPVPLITPLTGIQWRGLTNTWHCVLSAVLSTYFTDPHRTIEMDIVCICSN